MRRFLEEKVEACMDYTSPRVYLLISLVGIIFVHAEQFKGVLFQSTFSSRTYPAGSSFRVAVRVLLCCLGAKAGIHCPITTHESSGVVGTKSWLKNVAK
jgi:hypothetical protein